MFECKKCGRCCCKMPCGLIPEDLGIIANYLNISVDELIDKYMVVDYHSAEEEDGGILYYIAPRRKDDDCFKIAEYGWAFSKVPCIFLENKENGDRICSIHLVKPYGGRISTCEHGADKKTLAEKWKGHILKYIMIAKIASNEEYVWKLLESTEKGRSLANELRKDFMKMKKEM